MYRSCRFDPWLQLVLLQEATNHLCVSHIDAPSTFPPSHSGNQWEKYPWVGINKKEKAPCFVVCTEGYLSSVNIVAWLIAPSALILNLELEITHQQPPRLCKPAPHSPDNHSFHPISRSVVAASI
uniref:Uncharacterized protein n=1 Tax=Molossus molossus TaxID=27622 RepID=A0A7J8FSD7_MOLMO|nr:hypothetical protein HJG59_008425 [Molossus molossus]